MMSFRKSPFTGRGHLIAINMSTKLKGLGSTNGIVDDSKLNSNKFGRQLYDNLNSNVDIVSWIAISIDF